MTAYHVALSLPSFNSPPRWRSQSGVVIDVVSIKGGPETSEIYDRSIAKIGIVAIDSAQMAIETPLP
jgi:hypothetical protein